MKKLIHLAFSILLICIQASSQNTSALQFIENKGQWDSKVKFKGEMTNGAFFLTSSGFTVLQHNSGDLQQLTQFVHGELQKQPLQFTLHSHAYSVNFLNAVNARTTTDNTVNSYNNYFIGNDSSKWASNCKISEAVAYKNIYPNIDVRYYIWNQ